MSALFLRFPGVDRVAQRSLAIVVEQLIWKRELKYAIEEVEIGLWS